MFTLLIANKSHSKIKNNNTIIYVQKINFYPL